MQTPSHCELAHALTEHYFGSSVASVVRILFNYDQASLKTLRSDLASMKYNDLKKSLLILVKYQLVDYSKTVKNFSQQYEYSIVPQRLFAFFRITKFIKMTGKKEDPLASVIFLTLTEGALMSKEKLLKNTIKKIQSSQPDFNETKTTQITELVDSLVTKRFLVQTSSNLCINIEKFNRSYQNDLIVETIYNFYNKEAKIRPLCKIIIDLSLDLTNEEAAYTAPIPIKQFSSTLIPNVFTDSNQLDRYLNRLTTEVNNRFIVSSGNHPEKGQMYAINIGLVFDYLVREHISSLITTRFGPKCARVFKVLLLRGPLLLKQIEEIIMLPARDVREYSYMLIKEGYIRNRQVPKTPDNAPGKSVFIMSIQLDQIVYNAADLCCRTMKNLMIRHNFELQQNKVLLERAKAVQVLLNSSLGEGGSTQDDWNQYFNSHELVQLEKINRVLDKLLIARDQVDESLFLFHTWLKIRPNFEID